jgi:hypothetical protein
MPGSYSTLARSAMYHNMAAHSPPAGWMGGARVQIADRSGRPQGSLLRSNRLVGGEATPRSGPLRLHTVEEETEPYSDSDARIAVVAHSVRPKVVHITKPTQFDPKCLLGEKAVDMPSCLRIRKPKVENTLANCSGEALVPLSSAQAGSEDYDTVADLLNDYYEGAEEGLYHDRFSGELAPSLSMPALSRHPHHRESDHGHADMYVETIHTGGLGSSVSSSSSSQKVYRDTHHSGDHSHSDVYIHSKSRQDSTTSYVQNDYGTVSANIGSTLRVVNNPPAPSGVDPTMINLSNRNSVPFPSLPTAGEAQLHLASYSSIRVYPRHSNRVSDSTMNTIFSDSARSVHRLYSHRYGLIAVRLQEMFVEPMEHIMARVNSLPRAQSLRKTVRSLKHSAKKRLEKSE